MKTINTIFKTSKEMTDKLRNLEGKTKIKIYQNIKNYFDEMNTRQSGNFQFEEEIFSKF